MARAAKRNGPTPVESIVHDETRVNNPTADAAPTFYDEQADTLPPLLYPRNTALDPQLVWRGKDEQDAADLVVDAPPIYIQEKIDPRVLIENLRKTAAAGEPEPEFTLFDDFDGLDKLSQLEFYEHEAKWSNRMILGDSLQVMGSLAERERLRGKVQMIYLDPPYGIKFGSNFQTRTGKRDVKDGKPEDLAREAEQIKAFRDTWELGIHSYLSYLRDRLVVARDLLTESGSVFVQIGDENVHLVRNLMDEVFGGENFVSLISFKTTTGAGSFAGGTNVLASVTDYLVWYALDISKVKYRQPYQTKTLGGAGGSQYTWVELPDGSRRPATKEELASVPSGWRVFSQNPFTSQTTRVGQTTVFPVEFGGRTFLPSTGGWKTNRDGMKRLLAARRAITIGKNLRYVRYIDDFAAFPYSNLWDDTVTSGFSDPKTYVVQTNAKVIERCMLMCTDPGDLVLDPTCGSGTTAYVAEQWGRRWITIDTSRVALALARQRLMAGRYPYYIKADTTQGREKESEASGRLLPPAETRGDIRHGFVYERVQHITLKSIANNPDIREGMTRAEIDAAIKRHADFELLYDKPYIDKSKVRVSGPFTFESLSPHRSISFDAPPAERESISENAGESAAEGASFEQSILENLQTSGVQNGRRNERIEFATLDPYAGRFVQAIGERRQESGDDAHAASAVPGRIAVAIGPQYGTVSAGFIKDAAKEALADSEVDLLCVLGFAFDPQATGVTEADGVTVVTGDEFASVEGERKLGRIKVLLVRMNVDLLMGEALKKTKAANLFTVFGEPDIEVRETGEQLEVELRGVDVYDPTTGEVRSNSTKEIALWMIDTDYNEESFFVRHAYFTGESDPYKNLKVALKADIDPDAWAALYRTTSIPFVRPASGKIAVKVINDYGDEVMKVFDVGNGSIEEPEPAH